MIGKFTGLLRLLGATDGTAIGNVGDRLKVSTNSSAKFRVNFASPALAVTGSSYTSIYSYTGSGTFYGTVIDSNQDGFQLRVLIDGTEVVVTDISGTQLNGAGLAGNGYLTRVSAGSVAFFPPNGISYTTSLQILGKRDNNGALTVDNYIVYQTKET
jgi:hypothetical protein